MSEDEIIHLLRKLPPERGERTRRCPAEAELAAYVDDRLERDARHRVEGHIADCRFCLELIGFLVRIEQQAVPEEVPAVLEARARALVEVRESSFRPAHRWGAVAAAMAGAAVVLVLRTRPPDTRAVPALPSTAPSAERPEVRATPAPTEVRSRPVGPGRPEPISPRPGAVVRREDLEFRWRAFPRAVFYEVRLATAEGDLVWEGRASQTSLRPPKELRLGTGQKYYVWVGAHLPEARTVQSRAVAFRVRGPG